MTEDSAPNNNKHSLTSDLTTQHSQQTSMSPVGFEHTTPANELLQNYVLDRAAGSCVCCLLLRPDIRLADQLEAYDRRVACRESSLYAVCVLQCAATGGDQCNMAFGMKIKNISQPAPNVSFTYVLFRSITAVLLKNKYLHSAASRWISSTKT